MMEINGVELPTVCEEHWLKLREEIDKVGLTPWVANSGAMVAQMMADQVQRGMEIGNWDPLMNAWFAIQMNAMEATGPAYMQAAGKCIICFLNSARNADGSCACPDPNCGGKEPGSVPDFEEWLTRAAEGQLAFGKEKGIVK